MTNKQTLEALRLAEELNLGNHEFSTDASRLLKTQAQDIQRLGKSESDLIGERDHLEEIVNRVADAVLGVDRHEWSSYYDLEDAAQEIEDKMLEQHVEMEQLRAEVKVYTIQTANENDLNNSHCTCFKAHRSVLNTRVRHR